MDPLIGSALIGGAVNLIGGLFGKSSADKSASVQRQIALDQIASQERINQLNLEEAERNRQFQQQSIDNQNAWNSAVSQVQRYKQAGLNPYLLMQNGGQAVSASGASGAMAQVQNSDTGFQVMANAEANKQANYQSLLQHGRETFNNFIQAQALSTQNRKNIAEMAEVVQRTRDDSVRKSYQNYLDYYKAVESKNMGLVALTQDQLLQNQVKLSFEQTVGQMIDNKIKFITLNYHSERERVALETARQEWSNLVADYAVKKLTGKLTMKQIEHEVAKIAETWSLKNLNDKQGKVYDEQSKQLQGQNILWKFLGTVVGPSLDYLGNLAGDKLLDFSKSAVDRFTNHRTDSVSGHMNTQKYLKIMKSKESGIPGLPSLSHRYDNLMTFKKYAPKYNYDPVTKKITRIR